MTLRVVVLAAGEGKRFKSALPKPLHPAAGRPLLWHVLAAAAPLAAAQTVVVIGRGADDVRQAVEGFDFSAVPGAEAGAGGATIQFAVQRELRGTGDALAAALPLLPEDDQDEVLVLYGDTPLLTSGTLRRLLAAHRDARATATVLSSMVDDPHGYGRVLRDPGGAVAGIVEQRDATPEQAAVREVNAGVYVFARGLLSRLARLRPDNDQGEYYLTDLIALARQQGLVASCQADAEEIAGVNDRAQLAAVGAALRRRALETLMADGVTVVDPATTFVDVDVQVGPDTTLLPLTFLEAGTRVGAGCQIGPNARLVACTVEEGASITQAVAVQAHVGPRATVGPFAYLRPGADLGPGSKVGTYVEVKQASIGAGSKVPHLTYVGDAAIGSGVNVGAGTVFVNYDGFDKHRTTVGDGAFIGSATMLVAPLTVGDGAATAAGSTITRDVPPDALAIERAEQRTIEGGQARRRRRKLAEREARRQQGGG
jgi:bifunctional UDP-N-acetylglucosamine pyrophosphorylase/glucosamine-1-phosphate N-acetyltransferase